MATGKTCSIYLDHPTIKGDEEGGTRVNLETVNFSVDRTSTVKEGGGWHDTNAIGGQVVVTKLADKSSGDCFFEASKIPKARDGAQHDMTISFEDSDENEFFKISLINCQVTGYTFSGDSESAEPTEIVTISYQSLKEGHAEGKERGWNFGDAKEAS